MNHILELAEKNSDAYNDINSILTSLDHKPFDLDAFKQNLEKLDASQPNFGLDVVGFFHSHPQLIGYNEDGIGCKNLCDNSDSKILAELGITDESSEEEWENYYEATTDARCVILDQCSSYAVLIDINEIERTFVFLNDWFDPLYIAKYPIEKNIYALVW